jgi:hypothetical protein
LLQTEGAAQVIDDGDKQLVTEYIKKGEDNKSIADSITAVIRQVRAKAKPKAKPKERVVKLPGDGCVDLETAKAALPPACTIRRDDHQKRWQIFMGPKGYEGERWSRSRSWGVSGDEGAAVHDLLHAAWGRHCAMTGAENPLLPKPAKK